MMEKIVSEVSNRLTRCSICGHPHRIAHLHRIPSDTELGQYSCHLKFNDYIGSFLDGDILVDVYAFPVHYKRYVLEIVDRAKKEDEIPTT
jgi:hypothetical protein